MILRLTEEFSASRVWVDGFDFIFTVIVLELAKYLGSRG